MAILKNVRENIIRWHEYGYTIALYKNQEIIERGFTVDDITIDAVAGILSEKKTGVQAIVLQEKNHSLGQLLTTLQQNLSFYNPILNNTLFVEQTNIGSHIILFRCEEINPSFTLAMRKGGVIDDNEYLSMVEYIGQDDFIPTEGVDFRILQGERKHIPIITAKDREMLLLLCMRFDKSCTNTYYAAQHTPYNIRNEYMFGDMTWHTFVTTPIEDYNSRGTVNNTLTKKGFLCCGDITTYNNVSVLPVVSAQETVLKGYIGIHDKKLFLTHNTLYPTNKEYFTPFETLCLFEFEGDASSCIKYLISIGYGHRTGFNPSQLPLDGNISVMMPYTHPYPIKIPANSVRFLTFWDIVKGNPVMNDTKFVAWLNKKGVYLYPQSMDAENPYVIVHDNICEKCNVKIIKDIVKEFIFNLPDYVDGIHRSALENMLMRGVSKYFSIGYLEFLPPFKGTFLKDTSTESYLFFKNGIIKVTDKKTTLIPYASIDKTIWKSQIIPHDIHIGTHDHISSVFSKFINLIAAQDQEKINSFKTVLGYCVHRYKDPAKPYLVSFHDDSPDNAAKGGTGKGLIIQAISKVRKTMVIDGKKKNAVTKNFAFQRLTPDTEIVAIQDANKDFDIETIFNLLTEGYTVEQKFGMEQWINYSNSPKILINSNYSLKGVGDSFERRKIEVVLHPHFNKSYTPFDEFEMRLFDDWRWKEWNRFYNYMFHCTSLYLSKGVLRMDIGYMKDKFLKHNTSDDFVQFWRSFTQDRSGEMVTIAKNDMYQQFLEYNHLTAKEVSIKRFVDFINKVAVHEEINITSKEIRNKDQRINAWIIDLQEKNKK